MVIEQESNNFEELISSSDLPVLGFFYAPTSGPDHLMLSVIEQVDNQIKEQLRIVKIDSEKYPHLASEYQVHALPTLLLFKNGQIVERIEEEHSEVLMSPERLIQRLQPVL